MFEIGTVGTRVAEARDSYNFLQGLQETLAKPPLPLTRKEVDMSPVDMSATREDPLPTRDCSTFSSTNQLSPP